MIAPPAAATTQDLLPQNQTNAGATPTVSLSMATEAVAPSPSGATLGLGTTQQSQNQANSQTQDTNRDPVQESTGKDGTGGAGAVIRIVIPRPGVVP
jgi:hypothetical protein